MKVAIQLDRPAGDHGPPYTSMDYVRGSVLLSLQRADAVSRITVVLSGNLLSSVVAAATNPLDGTLHAVDNHKLFELCETIFPPTDVPVSPKGFSLPKGTKKFHFHLRFPILSTCSDTNHDWIKHLNTTLPPSIKVQGPNNVASGEMKYWLKVKVERPRRFKPDVTTYLEIKFLPLDPSLPPPMLRPVYARSTRPLLQAFQLGSSPPSSPLPTTRLENHAMTLEISLPSPAVLHVKHSIPLKASVTIKQGLNNSLPPVFLRALNITLRTETIVTVGPNSTTWPAFDEIINVSGLELELDGSTNGASTLDDGLWKIAVIPEMTPSFTSCTLVQQHFLIVAGGFSYDSDGPIQTIKTTINVDIHSDMKPAPNLTDSVNLENDHVPFIPWRVSSERHLGILRRSDSVSTSEPPPAYS